MTSDPTSLAAATRRQRILPHSKFLSSFHLLWLLWASYWAPVVANCPSVCTCKWKGGKQTVECVNQGLTVIPDRVDVGTQVLDMSGNNLQALSRDKFRTLGLLNLQRIYLPRCRIGRIDRGAFVGLTNLVELDLSDNVLVDVPTEALQDATSLMRLTLNGNPIGELKKDAFQHLSFLTTLELSRCSVENVETGAFDGLKGLEWLKMDANKLTTFGAGLSGLPPTLHGIDLHENPWHCDCHLSDLREWLVNQRHNVPTSIEPRCSTPDRLAGEIVRLVDSEEFACFPDVSPTTMYLEIAEGKNVSLLCRVSAVPEARVTWWRHGKVLHNNSIVAPGLHLYYYVEEIGTTNKRSELFIFNTSRDDNGTFICLAENPAGKAQSNYTIRIVVRQEDDFVPHGFADLLPLEYIVAIAAAIATLLLLIIVTVSLLVVKCKNEQRRLKRKKRGERTGKSLALQHKSGSDSSPSLMKLTTSGSIVGVNAPLPTKPNGSIVTVCEEMPADEMQQQPERNPDLINDTDLQQQRRCCTRRTHPREEGDGEETDGSGSRHGSYREAMENAINDYGDAGGATGYMAEPAHYLDTFPPQLLPAMAHPADVHLLPSRFLDTEGFPVDYGLPKIMMARHPGPYYPPTATSPQPSGCYFPECYPPPPQGGACFGFQTPTAATSPMIDTMPSPPAPYKSDTCCYSGTLPRSHSSGLASYPPDGEVPGQSNPPVPPSQIKTSSKVVSLLSSALHQNPIHESPDEGYEDETTTTEVGTEI